MKYFIGFLIRGEAAEWHNKIAKEISDKFGTGKIYERVPPHITIYPPLDLEDIHPVIYLLDTWSKSYAQNTNFVISDFGRFDDKVIFAKIEADKIIKEAVRDLRERLGAVLGMPKENYKEFIPHATLAKDLNAKTAAAIWEYISKLEKPSFIIPFNNVTLFSYDDKNKAWEVNKLLDLL